MDFKMKCEISNLMKIGIPEDLATISICKKYNKDELAKDYLEDAKQEQQLIEQELQNFRQIKRDELK